MRVQVRALLVDFELYPWTAALERERSGAQRVILDDHASARALLDRLVAEDPLAPLARLVVELDGDHAEPRDVLDRLAALIVRGLVIVTRAAVELIASDTPPPVYVPEWEGIESENSGIRPTVRVRVSFEVDELPTLDVALEVAPPMLLEPTVEVAPPPIPELEPELSTPPVVEPELGWEAPLAARVQLSTQVLVVEEMS